MTSKERILTTLKGEIPDRVPISCYELVGYNSFDFCNNEPSYSSLMDLIREKTDCFCMWNPGTDEQLGLSAAENEFKHTVNKLENGVENVTEFFINGRTLTRRTARYNGVNTVWTTEHLCKDTDDIDTVMSIPFKPVSFSDGDAPRIKAELGTHGILMPSLSDPAYLAMSMMEFGESLIWVMTETDHFEEVVKEFHRRNMINLENMLKTTSGDLYRICGPEYMCPPYLPPEYFERFMLPYLSDMVSLIHSYGRMAGVHCHGKVARVIDMIVETGCDAVDPCEESPDGDTTLEDLKARVGDKVCLFGSMQLKALENGSVDEVITETKRMVLAGKQGGRFVLMPTSAPINVPLSRKTEENYRAFIDTALEYGSY